MMNIRLGENLPFYKYEKATFHLSVLTIWHEKYDYTATAHRFCPLYFQHPSETKKPCSQA